MMRLDGSYRKITNQLEVSANTHITDYGVHASILKLDQVKDMKYLKSIGINSFKIYMNLGSSLNKILTEQEPGSISLKEIEVNMTDKLLTEILECFNIELGNFSACRGLCDLFEEIQKMRKLNEHVSSNSSSCGHR